MLLGFPCLHVKISAIMISLQMRFSTFWELVVFKCTEEVVFECTEEKKCLIDCCVQMYSNNVCLATAR